MIETKATNENETKQTNRTCSRPPARRMIGSSSCWYVTKMSAAPSWIWSCAMWNGQTWFRTWCTIEPFNS